MLPYLPPPSPVRFLGLHIPVFGLFLLAAALTAYLLLTVRGRRLGLGARVSEQLAGSLLLAAILGAQLAGTLLEHGRAVLSTPALLVSPDSSLSSAGGLAGAALVALLWARRLHLDRPAFLALADLGAHAFPFAWLVARTGCALVHDHPGRLSTSVLALPFPQGARLDCGLLELLATPGLVVLAVALSRARDAGGARQASERGATAGTTDSHPAEDSLSRTAPVLRSPGRRPPGLLAGSMAVAYSLLRFPLDFLRATDLPGSDTRYAGLTAAQWAALPLFAAGAWCLITVARTPRPTSPAS